MLFAWITDPNAWLALGTLTLLEIVLGIDNIIDPEHDLQHVDAAGDRARDR